MRRSAVLIILSATIAVSVGAFTQLIADTHAPIARAVASLTQAGGWVTSHVLPAGKASVPDLTGLVGRLQTTAQSSKAAGKSSATVQTDNADYPPGTQVNVTGDGWLPRELVELTFTETATMPPGGFTDGPFIFYATSDDQGNIANGDFSTDQHDLGVTFLLTAKGVISGRTAQTTFTDSLGTLFQIDGNANGGTGSSHDWNQVFADIGNRLNPVPGYQRQSGTGAIQFTTDGVNAASDDTFANSPKDTQDITAWKWGNKAVSAPKTDLAHGFAAAYQESGYAATYGTTHTLLYVGTDRFASGANSAISIWFLQHPIAKKADGTFENKADHTPEVHANGDLLIQASLGSTASVVAFRWVSGSLQPITLTAAQESHAINSVTIPVPWPFTDSSGSTSPLAQEFFEVGLDLNEVFQATSENLPDFSSFIVTTRTSTSQTATLSDFIVGNVSSGADITVSNIPDSTSVSTGAAVGYTVTVSNVGVGAVTGATLSDPLPLSVNWSIAGANPDNFQLSTYDGIHQQILTLPSNASVPFNASLTVHVTGNSTLASQPSITSTATVTGANEGADFTSNNTATGTIAVINNGPVAQNGTLTTNEDTPATGTLVATDSDSPTLTYSLVSQVDAHGTVTITNVNTGAYSYTPSANFNGPASFTFKANDGSVDSNTATVSITVNPVNDAPVAQNGTLTTAEDTATTGTLVATDIDSATLTYSVVDQTGAHGTVTITNVNTGAYSYTPAANYNGPASFTFKASDGSLNSNTATISITVTSGNDAPVAQDGTLTTAEDTATTGTLVATDIDSATLTYSVVSQANAHGTVSITNVNTGAYSYTPAANYNGPASFTFKANDGSLDSNTATISITVTAVNDAPANVSVNGDTLDENDIYDLSGSFADADAGDSHTVTINWADGSPNTTISLGPGATAFNASHQFLDDNASDTYNVTVTVSDGLASSAPVVATVTVHNAVPIVVMSTGAITLSPGDGFSRPGSFSDAGTLDTWSSTVDYGDGNGTQSLVLTGKAFRLTSPAYTVAGDHTVIVSIIDDDGGVGTQSFLVHVSTPAVIVSVSDKAVAKNALLSPPDFSFTGAPATAYAFSINWGDPSSGAANVQSGTSNTDGGGAGNFNGSHTYQHKGTYTVFVTVTDSLTGVSATIHFLVTVT